MNLKYSKQNKSLKKIFINALIFISFLYLTISVLFKNNNISEIIFNIKQVDLHFIGAAIIAMFIFVICEGININLVLKAFGYKISFLKHFKYALVGFFFSSITPSASGGQPAQIYFMSKDKISFSHSSLALLVGLSCYQLVSCAIAIIGFVYNYDIIRNIGSIKYLIALGLILNTLILLSLLIMILSKNFALKLLNLICKILNIFHYPKTNSLKEKFLKYIDEYHSCSLCLKNNKLLIMKIIIITFIRLTVYHSIPYFVYRSFGLNEINILTFIFIEAVLYISVSSLPLPGAMGVSEGGFMILFKMFFPATILSSAMIISRGISFYLFVIVSGLLIFLFFLVDNFMKKKKSEA